MARTVVDCRPVNTAKPQLDGLPPELLRTIFDFLGTDSKAPVALCSHSLLKSIGTRWFEELPGSNRRMERAKFLIILQRDLKDWLFCQHCEKLHRRIGLNANVDSLGDFDIQEPSPCVLAAGAMSVVPGFKLSFQYAQNLMDHHRFSRQLGDLTKHQDLKYYHIELDELSYEATMSAPRECDRLRTLKVSCSAQICANNLLFKTKSQIMETRSEKSTQVWHNIPSVCPHVTVLRAGHIIPSKLDCQLSHNEDRLCSRCGGLQFCRLCHTEFLIETERRQVPLPHLVKIKITAWKNLGPLYSLTDVRWTSQLEPPYERRDNYATFPQGSIREAFEFPERAGK